MRHDFLPSGRGEACGAEDVMQLDGQVVGVGISPIRPQNKRTVARSAAERHQPVKAQFERGGARGRWGAAGAFNQNWVQIG